MPDVKLSYKDGAGRDLNEKEAFRYHSHIFHGKGMLVWVPDDSHHQYNT